VRVFVTGHRGFIGAQLVALLKEYGHTVTGCDLNLFEGCEWAPLTAPDRELLKDIRRVEEHELEGHDCVMHLGAISNDPIGEIDTSLTRQINAEASIALAANAKRAGVPRFLFASSCSIYGRGERLDLDENDALNPVSAYAESKIEAETRIAALANGAFSPAFLRNATAYGDSPMLRVDLVANNLLACAVARGDIRIMSDGMPWRPFIHCRDIGRAFIAFAEAPQEAVHNRAVNVGANSENYQVKQVVDRVCDLVPHAKVVFTGEVGHDPRDYRVKFDLLGRLLPSFRLEYDLTRGMEELYRAFRARGFTSADFDGDRFVRLRRIRDRLPLLASASEAAA
jgi:nucleoside-diphosphate-sugar epimerase